MITFFLCADARLTTKMAKSEKRNALFFWILSRSISIKMVFPVQRRRRRRIAVEEMHRIFLLTAIRSQFWFSRKTWSFCASNNSFILLLSSVQQPSEKRKTNLAAHIAALTGITVMQMILLQIKTDWNGAGVLGWDVGAGSDRHWHWQKKTAIERPNFGTISNYNFERTRSIISPARTNVQSLLAASECKWNAIILVFILHSESVHKS